LNFFRYYKRLLKFYLSKKVFLPDHIAKYSNFTLDKLFLLFKTDKSSLYHDFAKYYEKKIKNKKIKNILEIGSATGASAASFHYYFPKATIYAADTHIECFRYKAKRIKTFLLDCTKFSMKNLFFKKINVLNNALHFDVVIDDGSHKHADIINAFLLYFKNVKSGGFYIIEDYKFPNYFKNCRNLKNEKFIGDFIYCLSVKKYFLSNVISKSEQKKISSMISDVTFYKGKSKISDICFIRKK